MIGRIRLLRIKLLAILCVLFIPAVSMSADAMSADPTSADASGESAPPTIYQEVLRRGEPSSWRPPNQNPPTFRWPMTRRNDTYELQYGTDPDFVDATTVSGVDRTFYRPERPLPVGEYFWRYRRTGGTWSEPLSFAITPSLPEGVSLDRSQALERIPAGHPRLWVSPETASEFARQAQLGLKRLVLVQWKAKALRYVGEPLALESDKERQSFSSYNERIGQSQSALADAEQTMGPAAELALLYLLTKDERAAGEAIRRAMAAARLDPDGYTSMNVNDLANAEIVRGGAMVYDYLYDRLTPEQRASIREMLVARLSRIYAAYRPGLEQEPYRSHPWQHIMSDFLTGALALYGEVPEASEWVDWGLSMFVAFYPWWGSVDGSSGGSAAYAMGPGMLHYSHLTAELIKAATGVDIMEHPWFANNPYYLIYAHPPGGLRSQFGDYRVQARPSAQLNVPMQRYAMRFQNPYATAYSSAVSGTPDTLESLMLYFLTSFQNLPAARPLSELPKARAFPDIGTVFMHSDIQNPRNNIMFEFKSSPIGSFGHSHADQNSFNIIGFGEILALDSGYYIGYGDTHHYGWTVTTAAHNAILIDGRGQPSRNLDAYGQLTDFFTGSAFHYAVGSAATAYGDAPVDRFLRHVLWIEPNAYIVFDEIDTGRPTDTQWLLHALEAMEIDSEGRWVHVRRGGAKLSVHLAYPDAGSIEQTSRFAVPVPEVPLSGNKSDYPDQWHLTASSPEKSEHHRWLAALFVTKRDEKAPEARRIFGEDWLGLNWASGQGSVWVGFSSSGKRVGFDLGDARALARGASVTSSASGDWALFATECTELYFRGRRVFASDIPVSVEVTSRGGRLQLEYDSEADVVVRIGLEAEPGSVRLDEGEIEFSWDESGDELLLTLPSGNHVLRL